MKRDLKLYRQLFFSTLKLSACTFGGGFVIVPLMKKRFVDELHWIDEQEMLDLIAVSQSSPGPLAVNASLMVGYSVAGLSGALITAIGTILPPMFIISIISLFYRQFRDNALVSAVLKGMQAGVAAVIANVVADMSFTIFKSKNIISYILMFSVFVAVYFFKINIIIIILSAGAVGLISGFVSKALKQRSDKKGGEAK